MSTEMTAKELREAIKETGRTTPFHVATKEALTDYLAAIKDGASEEELTEMFPKPVIAKPASDEGKDKTPEPPAAPTLTPEQVAQMIKDALAHDRASRPEPVQQTQQAAPAVYTMTKAAEKPDNWNSRQAAEDDFLPEGFRVFHSNVAHSFDKFQIDGRLVDPPFSKLITFETYHGPETQAFGASQNLSTMCVHTTYSKTIRDMFLNDARIGGEFWIAGEKVYDDDLELSILVSKTAKVLEGLGQADLKTMCEQRDLPLSDLDTMRARIALHDSKKTQAQRKLDLSGRSLAMEKEILLNANG